MKRLSSNVDTLELLCRYISSFENIIADRSRYWDWVADSSAPASAKVWDPVSGPISHCNLSFFESSSAGNASAVLIVKELARHIFYVYTDSEITQVTGFGGNGTTTNSSDPYSYCVTDGPFTKLKLAYKSNDTHSHCLERDFYPAIPQANPPLQEMLGWGYNPTVIAGVNSNTDFLSFHSALEGGPHNIVHAGIGGSYGDMGPLTSPNGMFITPCLPILSFFAEFRHVGVWNVEDLARSNEFLDPIFFLHHTQVDRLWWLWQQVSPSNRTNDYAGNLPDGSAASLTDLMPMMGLASDRMVSAFMSTQTTDLCYKY
jgi:hypothetical protein